MTKVLTRLAFTDFFRGLNHGMLAYGNRLEQGLALPNPIPALMDVIVDAL